MDVLLQAVGLAVAGRARRGALSRVADGADAARARAAGGVTSVRRRHPGVGLLAGVVASVTVIAAGLALVIQLDGGALVRARARGDALARGGARDGAMPRASSGRWRRGPSSFPRTTVPIRRSAPSGGTGPGTSARRERGRAALRVPADVLPHGAGAPTLLPRRLGVGSRDSVSRALRGDGRRGGRFHAGSAGPRRARISPARAASPFRVWLGDWARRGDRRRRGLARFASGRAMAISAIDLTLSQREAARAPGRPRALAEERRARGTRPTTTR